MAEMTFVIDDASTGGSTPLVQIRIVENGDGTLAFTVTQLAYAGAYLGDLRGLFFDIGRESLIGTLSVTGAPASFTEIQQGDDAVKDLGQGANMQGLLGSDGGYDVGIEIGSSGIGKSGDDVRSFSFILRSSAGPLTLADFANVDFGVRVTSVGQDIDGNGSIDTTRDGSAKIGETTDPIGGDTDDGDAAVTITGTAQEDSVLAASFADDDPDGPATGVTYQWRRDGVDILGATDATYTLGDDDVGATITVVASYTDGQGFAETIESAPTAAVLPFDDGDAAVTITGTAQEDSVLAASFADDDPDGPATGVTYQWRRDGVDILGATDATYTLGGDDVGATITVVASYTDGQGFAEAITSAPTAPVAPEPPIANSDTVLTNVVSGSNIVIPGWALLANDTDPQNDPLFVGSVGSAAPNDLVSLAFGDAIYVDNSPLDGSFVYTASDGASQSAAASATVDTQIGTIVTGGAGNEILIGTSGIDTLNANGGNDHLFGGLGNDTLNGGAGNDVYGFAFSGDGNDAINDVDIAAGSDRIVIEANGEAFANLNFIRVDGVVGGETPIDDLLISYNGQSILVLDHFEVGFRAIEQIQFIGGATLYGYTLHSTSYQISFDSSPPQTGTAGNDILMGADFLGNTPQGLDGDDILFGAPHNNDNPMQGGTGNDLLIGLTGGDNLEGGAGDDTYVFQIGDGIDQINELPSFGGAGTDRIVMVTNGATLTTLGFSRFLPTNNSLIITYSDGTPGTNQITDLGHFGGVGVEEIMFFGGGTVFGYQLGTDVYKFSSDFVEPLDGGADNDVIISQTAVANNLNGNDGKDLLYGNDNADTLNGGADDDLLVGGTGADTLSGGDGNDVLFGGASNDTLNSDLGDDRFVYTAASDSTLAARDTINGFTAAGTDDAIDLDAFNFSGLATDAIKETSPAAFTNGDALDFFDDAGTDRAVAVEYFGGDAQVYVDANKDGNFTAASDLVVQLDTIGINALTVGDFLF